MSDTITAESYTQSSQPDLTSSPAVTARYTPRVPRGVTYARSLRQPDPSIDAKARLALLRALATDRQKMFPLYHREATQEDQDARRAVYLTQLGEIPKA